MNLSTMKRWRGATSLAGFCALAVGCGRPQDLGPVANASIAGKMREALVKGGEGSASAVAASTGTGWGSIKGRFLFGGEPPDLPPYGVNKDHDVCAPGGSAPKQEFLKVDADSKGIANVVVYPREVARVHDSAKPSEEQLVFDQKVCVFLTHVLPFSVGQPVAIKNSDPVGHNTSIEGQNRFNQTIPAGESVPYKAQRQEATPVAVRCSIHPWMLAYMLPRENAYFAVTASDGSFEIQNLPAGEELEIQVWHEHQVGRALVVDTPEAKELDWDKKGRFTVTLEADQTREIEITVPPGAFKGG